MGWFSSACSAVGSAFSSACSAVGSACASALGSLSSVCSGVLSLAKVLPLPNQVSLFIKAVVIIDAVCKVLGLLQPDEKTEDLGDRALQAGDAGIRPEDYATYQEYVNEIRNFKLDTDKSEKTTKFEKMAAGVGVQMWGMTEKYGEGSGELLPTIIKDTYNAEEKGTEPYLTGERVKDYIDAVNTVKDVADYFASKLDPDKHNEVEAKLVAVEKANNPEVSDTQIYNQLDECRNGI